MLYELSALIIVLAAAVYIGGKIKLDFFEKGFNKIDKDEAEGIEQNQKLYSRIRIWTKKTV